ncbi:MAG: GPW/gp25 family protein [Lachnospiraceae bacterium]|nr:GPW/gp25 family protein [Lachnospiraceae bacterium]
MEEKKFLGTGMKFPPQINPTTGRFTCVSGRESIKESVYLILMTQRTERFMRPDFGSRVMGYVFAQTDATMLNLMAHEIAGDIMRSEPRIEQVNVSMDQDSRPGCLFINVDYTVRGENVRENMVFPFYLGEEPEKESVAYETMEEYHGQ